MEWIYKQFIKWTLNKEIIGSKLLKANLHGSTKRINIEIENTTVDYTSFLY